MSGEDVAKFSDWLLNTYPEGFFTGESMGALENMLVSLMQEAFIAGKNSVTESL